MYSMSCKLLDLHIQRIRDVFDTSATARRLAAAAAPSMQPAMPQLRASAQAWRPAQSASQQDPVTHSQPTRSTAPAAHQFLVDSEPFAASCSEQEHVCPRCAQRYTCELNKLRCPCVRGSLSKQHSAPRRVAKPRSAPAGSTGADMQPWQAVFAEQLAPFWSALHDTDAANLLNASLDGTWGSRTCVLWQLTSSAAADARPAASAAQATCSGGVATRTDEVHVIRDANASGASHHMSRC